MGKSGDATRVVEVELKFDAPESGGTPCFDGLAIVSRVDKPATEHLDAVYFDTVNHDLAVNWMTLRRRTGGHDEGWHLKLPAGKARTEVRAPLGSTEESREVPEALLDVVRAIVRDRPLVPVARISTARDLTMLYGTDGSALAEFCNDTVTACRLNPADGSAENEQQWREWELELVDAGIDDASGILERLAHRLHDAGGAPAGHGSKLAKVLGESTPARPEPPSGLRPTAAPPIRRRHHAPYRGWATGSPALHAARPWRRQAMSAKATRPATSRSFRVLRRPAPWWEACQPEREAMPRSP